MMGQMKHFEEPPQTCASWVPERFRNGNVPTLEELQDHLAQPEARRRHEEASRGNVLSNLYFQIPALVAVAALAVGAVDTTLNLHLANKMAHVKRGKHDGALKGQLKDIIHEVGTEAEDVEK